MGGLTSSNKQKKREQIKANNTIGKELRCETCLKTFPPQTKIQFYGNHIKNCYNINKERERIENLLNDLRVSNYEIERLEKQKIKKKENSAKPKRSQTTKKPNTDKVENFIDPSDIFFMPPEIFFEKTKKREIKNKQKEEESEYDYYSNINLEEMSNDDFQNLRSFPFEEKIKFFKSFIKNIKVDWREGSCKLEIDRSDFFRQSMIQFDKIDPYKELKINFMGEVSHDAGGLIREWYSIIFKYLQSEKISKKNIIFNL